MNKKLFLPMIFASVAIVPIAFSTSCNQNVDIYQKISAINTIKNSIISGDIQVCIDKDNVKITDLSKCKFDFVIKDGIDNKSNIEEALNVIDNNISYLDFFIPKYNDDENSSIIFQVSNINDESNYIQLNFNRICNKDKQPITIINLNEEEIKNTINEKLYSDYSFIPSLHNLIYSKFIKNFESDKNSFNDYLNENNDSLVELISNFIFNKYICFNEYYNNIVINDIQSTSDSSNAQKVILSFKISTSQTMFNESAFEIQLPFVI